MCSDSNQVFQDRFLCRAVAAYALVCAKAGSPINWMSDPVLNQACHSSGYGVCEMSQTFQDCNKNCQRTCKDLSTMSNEGCEDECAQGCSCPNGQLLDERDPLKPKCVPIYSCSCYDSNSKKYYPANSYIQSKCSNW